MTPGARLAAAIEVLGPILEGAPAEKTLTSWARAHRFAGSKDRAAIRDIVFDVLRQKRSFGARVAPSARGLVIAWAQAQSPSQIGEFNGAGYAPDPLSADEEAALAQAPSDDPAILSDLPDWVIPEFQRSSDQWLEVAKALRDRAPVDLRVNLLKADIAGSQAALRADGIEAVPLEYCPTALRVETGARQVAGSRAYRDGLVELQDVASQRLALFAQPQPGMRVLDYCAGGGGKALALAAQMEGRGQITAHDIDPKRMSDIPARAKRAGAKVICAAKRQLMPRGYDLIFVDAPCSGTGSWRRSPAAKWVLTPDRLAELQDIQKQVLIEARRFLAPGGWIIYATCSVLRSENQDIVHHFAQDCAKDAQGPALRVTSELALTPLDGGDGFYAACLMA